MMMNLEKMMGIITKMMIIIRMVSMMRMKMVLARVIMMRREERKMNLLQNLLEMLLRICLMLRFVIVAVLFLLSHLMMKKILNLMIENLLPEELLHLWFSSILNMRKKMRKKMTMVIFLEIRKTHIVYFHPSQLKK